MHKRMPLFILLFAGYLCIHMHVAEEITTPSPTSYFPTSLSKVTETHEPETTTNVTNHISGEPLSTLLVAGISIFMVFLIVLVLISVWCARKKSKGSLAQINSAPCGESGVSLEKNSTHEK